MTTPGLRYERNQTIVDHMPLARAIALSVVRNEYDHDGRGRAELFDEVLADAHLGLVQAADSFDPSRGCPFPSFAGYRIMGAIRDGRRRRSRLSRRDRTWLTQIEKARGVFLARELRFPKDREVAVEMDISYHEFIQVLERADRAWCESLEKPVAIGEEGDATLADVTPDPAQEREIETVENGVKDVYSVIERLSDREQVVIRLSFWQDWTQEEIGKLLGVSVSRVCQVRTRALHRLRDLAPHLVAAA